ncbi:MAG TPA: hypothetical protein PKX25_15910 [Microthrixaceae bacterium]|nr:hypothetical protein [Microthrixaceae bacterium]MCB9375852.1 hypothetical protein [Microthrixaceae bacterium]MCB9400986.1 hypothetical protein [Microthrixaceae bacterium]MCO5305284.1 hypothetical protein [Microthrixaceae bacterium]HMU79269.1 hypothetical protein [Microthrixaceae bacterium]
MPTTAVRRIAFAALIAAASIGPIAACSDDSDDAADTDSTTTTAEATATASATDDLDAFCAAATELVGVTPTSEQLAEYAQLAPQDIAAPVETFIAAFESADGDLGAVFADPEASAAADEIAAFESEACGITQPGPPPGAPGTEG